MNPNWSVVPRLNPHDSDQCDIIAQLAPPVIALSYYDVIERPSLYDTILAEGRTWFEKQGIYSRIIVDTVAPERICERLDMQKFAAFVRSIHADVWMTPDANVYLDSANVTNDVQISIALFRAQQLMHMSLPGMPLGTLKGATPSHALHMRAEFEKMGIKYCIFPSGDFLKGGTRKERLALERIIHALSTSESGGDRLILHGINNPALIRRYRLQGSVVITPAWWTLAAGHMKSLSGRNPRIRVRGGEELLMHGIDTRNWQRIFRANRLLIAYDNLHYLMHEIMITPTKVRQATLTEELWVAATDISIAEQPR